LTLLEALSATAGLLWAITWCAVGCVYAWWAGVIGFVVGGIVGAAIALLGLSLLLESDTPTSRLGMFVKIGAAIVGLAAYVLFPTGVLFHLHRRSN